MLDISQGAGGAGIASTLGSAMPWGAAIGALGSALSTPPAGPSEAKSSGSIGSNLDTSGWNVTYGDNSGVDVVRSQSAPGVSATGGAMSDVVPGIGSALGGVNMQYVLLAVGAVVLLKVLKRKQA